MSSSLQIEGQWEGGVSLRKGWGRATARPWNPVTAAGAVRLLRGSSGFLVEVTQWVLETARGPALSPALYPTGLRVWERSGYEELLRLDVMEKAVEGSAPPQDSVTISRIPDVAELERLDRGAFDEFWHMSAAGIREALHATQHGAVAEFRVGRDLAGYAVFGAQLGVAFLQRIAVDPAYSGKGVGTALLEAADNWARAAGARSIVLNVKPENERARALYLRNGFRVSGGQLVVMQFAGDSPSPEQD